MANPTPEQLRLDNTRAATIEPSSYRDSDNSIEVVWSTGAVVRKYDFWTDEIYNEDLPLAGMDTSRLDGAPVLRSHDTSVESVIGVVLPGTTRVSETEARSRIQLSTEPGDAEVVNKIKAGIIRQWSYGYEKVGKPTVTVDESTGAQTRQWSRHVPYEISSVALGADPFTYTRSLSPMSGGLIETGTAAVTPKEKIMAENTEKTPAVPEVNLSEVRALAMKDERERQNSVRSAGKKLGVSDADVEALLVDENLDVNACRAKLIDLAATRDAATPTHPQHDDNVRVVVDAGDTRIRAITEALEVRAHVAKPTDLSREYRGATLIDIASDLLAVKGTRTRGMTRGEIANMATRAPAGHVSNDFPILLSNIANKVLVAAFENSPGYDWYTRCGSRNDFQDYKARSYPSLSGLGTLPLVLEGAEYVGVTQNEAGESVALSKYGSEFRLGKEMVVNDDLSGFLRKPKEFGEASARTASAVALAAFAATMGDGHSVFDLANHANVSTSGGAPTVARINELEDILLSQTDGNGAVIGLPGSYLFAPTDLRTTIEQLFSDRVLVTDPADAVIAGIPAGNRIYIPGMSTSYFMGTADTSAFEYGWLSEEGGPVVSQYPDYSSDAILYHCTMSFAAVVLKFQRFAQNAGA